MCTRLSLSPPTESLGTRLVWPLPQIVESLYRSISGCHCQAIGVTFELPDFGLELEIELGMQLHVHSTLIIGLSSMGGWGLPLRRPQCCFSNEVDNTEECKESETS